MQLLARLAGCVNFMLGIRVATQRSGVAARIPNIKFAPASLLPPLSANCRGILVLCLACFLAGPYFFEECFGAFFEPKGIEAGSQ